MAEKCACGMPLDDKSSCQCNPKVCCYCCECSKDCICGCQEKAKKEEK